MKSTMAKIGAAVMVGMVAFGSVAPAFAQQSIELSNEDSNNNRQRRDMYVQRYCDGSGYRDRDCRDWRDHRGNWDNRRYQRWYGSHYRSNGDAIAAGIFGLAIGAIVNGAINNSGGGSSHVRRCEARFQSYDRRTDTYLGFDGRRHACNL